VGGDSNGPEIYFGIETFHRRMQERRARWPFTMNAGSTHDTKRSEDVRARINVLSEIPQEWARAVKRWSRLNAGDSAPDPNEQVLIYQSMLGAWPIDAERLKQYVVKALREAKIHTSWINIDEGYERRVLAFVDRILDPALSVEFLEDFTKLHKKVAFYGALSSLAQTTLRMTVPGVPDFYQGTETWDFSLADPDNRRPVDFAARARMLDELKTGVPIDELLRNWPDGRIKMYVVGKTLGFRREHCDLFLRGDYIPLRVNGARADNVVAFARRHQDEWAITVVPRLVSGLTRPARWPTGPSVWLDTVIEFDGAGPAQWLNILTGEVLVVPLVALRVFGTFPVAVLYGSTRQAA
jgi:(1->4)-alpha-D-glucan 1-alpha-D-glucosylmutase